MTEPEWLTARGGSLQAGPDGKSWYLVFSGQPQYRLTPVPAKGKYGCSIMQTINSRFIPSDSLADSLESAVQAGLHDLALTLGWR